MPINDMLIEHDHSFSPDEIAKIVAGFEAALAELNLIRRDDPATSLVAKIVFDAAKAARAFVEQPTAARVIADLSGRGMASDLYRRRAFEAQLRAAQAADAELKEGFALLAQEWFALAEQVDWLERRFASVRQGETDDQSSSDFTLSAAISPIIISIARKGWGAAKANAPQCPCPRSCRRTYYIHHMTADFLNHQTLYASDVVSLRITDRCALYPVTFDERFAGSCCSRT
jgi:hypothetical protein